jgi:predicted AlkP superfamily phosphohydrolase/phosphomutase
MNGFDNRRPPSKKYIHLPFQCNGKGESRISNGIEMKSFSKKKKKALIIGIDGVPYSLLHTYLNNNIMPNLKKMLTQGFTLHSMYASIPDISSVSWTSFVTGVNPGEHGIYGFMDLKPNSYSLYFPNSKDIKAPTMWDILGRTTHQTSTLYQHYYEKIDRPYRSIILNVPHTYPALPMNGILVSGFVAIDLKKAIFPTSVYTPLHSMNYLIDVDAEKAQEDKKGFLKALFECFEIRKEAITHFFDNESWDLFVACITETDRLHHFFFDASEDETNVYHKDFLLFYSRLDEFIMTLYKRYIEKYSDQGFFMILSDHGFTPIKKEVYINRFLEERGFLTLKSAGHYYERIEHQTRAFDLDPCRIYLHDQEVYPRGIVRKEEKTALIKEIKEALNKLKGEDGEAVIDTMYEKEELYHGPYANRAPDLVCLPKDGYDLKGSLEKKEVFGHNIFTGMHTWHDAFCILPEDMGPSQKPSIENMADYMMKYFIQ